MVFTGDPPVADAAFDQDYMPRVVPTPCHIRALQGSWSLEGRVVRMYQEPDTGVLLAVNEEGESENPLRVISRGKKIGAQESEATQTPY